MCGRFTLAAPERLASLFPAYRFPKLTPRYNIAPTQPVLALANHGANEAEFMRWGMGGNINARAETVAVKPSFRDAARARRAIVFADGYYEWRAFGDGKQPYYIHRPDAQPFTFAALWDDELHGADGRARACTLITTEATRELARIHDRMPVILDDAARDAWLAPDPLEPARIDALLHRAEYALESYPVSLAVNRVANEDARLIERAAPPEQGSFF